MAAADKMTWSDECCRFRSGHCYNEVMSRYNTIDFLCNAPHIHAIARPWGIFFSMTWHYIDVIMTTMASQITSLTVVYSTVYSDADQSKHQSSASLAFVWGIHRDRWIPHIKGQLRGKCFHLMTSSWCHDMEMFPRWRPPQRASNAGLWCILCF